MNKIIAVLLGFFVLVGVFLALKNYQYQGKIDDKVNMQATSSYETFTDPAAGLEFTYKVAPDGYVVDDLSSQVVEEAPAGVEVVKAYRLMNQEEKLELEHSTVAREGPPAINLFVLTNPLHRPASTWVDEVPQFSNIEMVVGEVDRDAVVGGANAVRYTIDGLYLTDTVVVASGGFIYLFTGSYLEPEATIHQDFKALLDTVSFIPTDEQLPEGAVGGSASAKIDPRVACESALAYMTFADGEAADSFVRACVDGKHPEVIERYINDMGLDGVAI